MEGKDGVARMSVTGESDPGRVALMTRGLRKCYGRRTAVEGLDLSVPTGVVYGFLGPNGAGKTTTMRMLAGLIEPDAGFIQILGSTFSRSDRAVLHDVGALVESPAFYPFLSAKQNLMAFGATGNAPPNGRIDELLELVGLADRASDRVQDYSLGMKQRLGVATALLSDPQLLLLDEPANGLDPAGIAAVRETLRDLVSMGKTVFVSSHLLSEVRLMADVVGIIAAGRLVREGPIDELLAGQSQIRLHVAPEQTGPALRALATLPGPGETSALPDEPGWLTVAIHPDRGAEVSRSLAMAGIYPMALEPAGELEPLFLRLTGRAATDDTGLGRLGIAVGDAHIGGAA